MTDYTLPHPASDSRLNPINFSIDGRFGLPNSVREALLGMGEGESALVMDALLYTPFSTGKGFTFRKVLGELRQLGFSMSGALIRRALNSRVFDSERIYNRRVGRPEKLYHMPPVERLVQVYAHGAMSAADALTVTDMHSLTLYRQGLHREFIRRAPGIYSRQFLAQRLGVGQRTTRNYDQRVGVRAIRRLRKQNVLWYSDWEALIKGGTPGLNWLRVCYQDGRFFDAPLVVGIALRYLWKSGVQAVYFITQLCNRYVYAPEDDWADHQPLYRHDDERTFAASSPHPTRLDSDPVSATLSVDPKAYQATSDPLPAWLPPDMAAKRISTNPFLPGRESV